MRRQTANQPAALLKQGLKELGQHRPDKAINSFRSASEKLTEETPLELSNALYWLAVALRQMGQNDLALKSLATAQKLWRHGTARKVYVHSINEYGMTRRASPDLDDFFAFMHLQLAKYLGRKSSRRFASLEEHEAVMDTLFDAWKAIQVSEVLAGLSCAEKALFFRRTQVSFPVVAGGGVYLSSTHRRADNARSKPFSSAACEAGHHVALATVQRCPCGSGLPYLQCCGRIKSIKELF